MPLSPRSIRQCLENKLGFTLAPTKSPDHEWYELHLPGKPPIRTKISRHNRDYSDALLGKMARQLRVRKAFFLAVVDCIKSCSEYVEQVNRDPYPPWGSHVIG